MNLGYIKVATFTPEIKVADVEFNLEQIKKGIICNTFMIFIIIILGIITNTTVYTYAEKIGLRGWFYNSNSQSIILCFCVPVMLFYLFKTKKIFWKIVSVCVGYFLLFTNGTTGCYLMIVPAFSLILLDTLVSNMKKKSKVLQCVFLIAVISSSFFLHKYSPDYKISVIAGNSYQETQKELDEMKENEKPSVDNSELNNDKSDVDNSESNNDKSHANNSEPNNDKSDVDNTESNNSIIDNSCKDVECGLIDYYFDERFVQDYGYDVIKKHIGDNFDVEHLVNNRYRKKLVAKVMFNESGVVTKILGFGFSNIKKYDVDLESDYSAIMYYFGYLGLLVYVLVIIYAFYILIKKFIQNPKIIFNMEYILFFSMLIMFNLFAEVSGSLLKRPNVSIYVALLLIIIMIKDREKEYAKKSSK